MAQASKNDSPSESTTKAATQGLGQKLLLVGFLVLNLICMGGGLGAIYYFKVVYHRPAITEESESAVF